MVGPSRPCSLDMERNRFFTNGPVRRYLYERFHNNTNSSSSSRNNNHNTNTGNNKPNLIASRPWGGGRPSINLDTQARTSTGTYTGESTGARTRTRTYEKPNNMRVEKKFVSGSTIAASTPKGESSEERRSDSSSNGSNNKNDDDDDAAASPLLRKWTPQASGDDPEIKRREEEIDKARRELHQLRENGRQYRVHRLQALDALETKRMTLIEIFKRMEKELQDKNVYEYGDVLAEVFGERKIFAHRAIGLEALLCQFMHQMLAKQHQMKIMKKSAKDIQSHYKRHRMQNKDEFYSYEALAVQLEASRLSLEATYDDIFASQHKLLASLTNVEAGGTMTNYSIVKPKPVERKPKLTVTTKHNPAAHDTTTPMALVDSGGDSDDYESAMDILTHADQEGEGESQPESIEENKEELDTSVAKLKGDQQQKQQQQQQMAGENDSPTIGPKAENDDAKVGGQEKDGEEASFSELRRSSITSLGSQKSARERRREIEHLRQAGVVGKSSSITSTTGRSSPTSSLDDNSDSGHQKTARERMRKLEAVRERMGKSIEVEKGTRRSSDSGNSTENSKEARRATAAKIKNRTSTQGVPSTRAKFSPKSTKQDSDVARRIRASRHSTSTTATSSSAQTEEERQRERKERRERLKAERESRRQSQQQQQQK